MSEYKHVLFSFQLVSRYIKMYTSSLLFNPSEGGGSLNVVIISSLNSTVGLWLAAEVASTLSFFPLWKKRYFVKYFGQNFRNIQLPLRCINTSWTDFRRTGFIQIFSQHEWRNL